MSVTVAALLSRSELHLRLLAGAGSVTNPVRWVHISELDDPTPFLRGGELLLTLGLRLPRSGQALRDYVRRLVATGVAGLGFGTGLGHDTVPADLVEACADHALPMFEVPLPTPFLAISEAVADQIATEERALLQAAFDRQRALTRAALDAGSTGVLRGLARLLGGWAMLCDPLGRPVEGTGSQAHTVAAELTEELARAREHGLQYSLTMVTGSDHVTIQPLGVHSHVRGLLAVGKPGPFAPLDQLILTVAVTLLALELEKSADLREEQRRLQSSLLDLLTHAAIAPAEADRQLRHAGLPAGPVRVIALSAREARLTPVADDLEDQFAEAGIPALVGTSDHGLAALVSTAPTRPSDSGDATPCEALRSCLTAFCSRRPGAVIGVGEPASLEAGLEAVVRSARQAQIAVAAADPTQRPVVAFESLGMQALLLSLPDPTVLSAYADSILAPLDRNDRHLSDNGVHGHLIVTLHTYLAHDGRADRAAAELEIHRNTLRYRLRKIEQLTGISADSTQGRLEFWLALQAREPAAEV